MLVCSFCAYCSSTSDAVQSLLDLLTLLLPTEANFPKTVHLLEKHFPLSKADSKFYCQSCLCEMVEIDNDSTGMLCHCNKQRRTKKELKDTGCHYLTLSIAKQLRHLLQDCKLGSLLDYRFTRREELADQSNDGLISDIYDGRLYQEFKNGKLMKNRFAVSLTNSIDGVPGFNSSSTSF